MEFLHGLKYILALNGISKSKSVKVVGIHISTAFIQWFIGVGILINIAMQFGLCIKLYQMYGIQSILVPSHFVFYYISLGFIFGSLLRNADMIFELFEFIEQIIKKRSKIHSESSTIYSERHSFNEKIMYYALWYVVVPNVLIHVVEALCPIIYVFLGYPSPKSWYLTLSTDKIMPFNTETPIPFEIAMLIDTLCVWPAILVGMAFFCLYVSICMYIWSLIADLEIILSCSNKNIQQNRPIKLQCERFIQLHLDCHRIIATLEKIISIPVSFLLPTYGFEFAIVLFHLENDIHDIVSFISITIEIKYHLLYNFLICYFLTSITTKAMEIGDAVYNLLWYDKHFPSTEQSFVIMNIYRSQQPIQIKGLGWFSCSLETYLAMIRSAISYYMIFRQL